MRKPAYHGQQFGCHDQAPPEKYTPEHLSRVRDMLLAAEKVDEKLAQQVFKLLPDDLKCEFAYSNWKYVEEGHIGLSGDFCTSIEYIAHITQQQDDGD